MSNMLVIVPTRGRGASIRPFIDNFMSMTSADTSLLLALDEDDEGNYERVDGVLYEVNPRMRMIGTLNKVVMGFLDYDFIGFMGDDHFPRSKQWDTDVISTLSAHKAGIVYGDDLLMHENLPTAAFMSINIIKNLGYMVPTFLKHFYADNYWKDLGNGAGCLHYNPQIVVEHMHFSVGKSVKDDTYESTSNDSVFIADRDNYEAFKADLLGLQSDINKIKNLIYGIYT